MSSTKIQQLLNDTLNPSITKQAEHQLINNRQNQGFLTQLLVIGDDQKNNIQIRQSSLIYIKNAILDHYGGIIRIPQKDFQIIKSSILQGINFNNQALIRNCQEKLLTPTIREIIFILGEKQLGNWETIIQDIVKIIAQGEDFNQLFGGIQALKAIVSAYGRNANNKVALSNLCNKIVLPLLSFSSKLFQSYNSTTSPILLSIFKIFSTITYFHLPDMIMLNMHNWMIFIKKLLDLNISSSDNMDRIMYQLKKICLRILFRFYQRHFNLKNSNYSSDIVLSFHDKYTNGIVQSLLLQIMNQSQLIKSSSNSNKVRKFLELTKFSIACLSYIYDQYRPAAELIDKYSEKIIYLCLDRYRFRGTKNYSSYSQFFNILSEQRAHFCRFIISLLKNQTYLNCLLQQQNNSNIEYSNFNSQQVAKILGCLFNHIEKGDEQIKQLCFYIFSQISTVLPGVDDQINDKMQMFILRYVKPLLQDNNTSSIIKLRCCQILTKYSYINIPQEQLTQIGSGVYGCLISSNNNNSQNNSMSTFLQIQAVHAFNSLLRYDFIVNFTSNSLSNILSVYTQLLEIEPSIIKCLEDLMDRFENYLQPFGQNLIQMLGNMFFKYVNMYYNNQINTNFNKNGIKSVYVKFKTSKQSQSHQEQDDQQYQDDDEFDNQQENIENNYLVASKACLGAIRQIIVAPNFYLSNHSLIHNLLIHIFTDKQEFYTEQGFNILNLSLFKQKYIQPEYNLYFTLIINSILPVSQSLIQALQKQNSSYSATLLKMLEINSSNPDEDIIQNTIGCLRNYIAKYGQKIRQQYDQTGTSFLKMIFDVVKYTHQNQCSNNNDEKQATQSQRSIILTLYISLIQYNVISDDEMAGILKQVGDWLNMQTQAVQQNNNNNNSNIKITYTPIYLQIFLLAIHFYPKVSLGFINSQWFFTEIIENVKRFTCDYEVSRLLIGLADMLNCQFLNDQNLSQKVMNLLPDLIELQVQLRKQQGNGQINVVNEDQAQQQDKYFGLDQNTHFLGVSRPQMGSYSNNQQNQQNQMQSQSDQQQQWDDEFNKFYTSPLDEIDEVMYMCNVLKSQQGQVYMNLMQGNDHQRISNAINNLKSKVN